MHRMPQAAMSALVLGVLLALLAFTAAFRRVPAYDAFLRGAREGLHTALQVAPCLLAIVPLCAALEACGAIDALCGLLAPALARVGIPQEVLPLLLMRPLSGSASLGLLEHTLAQVGADTYAGRVASVVCGANETIFYLCALYLGTAGVKKSRYILPAALAGYVAACASAGFFCTLFS